MLSIIEQIALTIFPLILHKAGASQHVKDTIRHVAKEVYGILKQLYAGDPDFL